MGNTKIKSKIKMTKEQKAKLSDYVVFSDGEAVDIMFISASDVGAAAARFHDDNVGGLKDGDLVYVVLSTKCVQFPVKSQSATALGKPTWPGVTK